MESSKDLRFSTVERDLDFRGLKIVDKAQQMKRTNPHAANGVVRDIRLKAQLSMPRDRYRSWPNKVRILSWYSSMKDKMLSRKTGASLVAL